MKQLKQAKKANGNRVNAKSSAGAAFQPHPPPPAQPAPVVDLSPPPATFSSLNAAETPVTGGFSSLPSHSATSNVTVARIGEPSADDLLPPLPSPIAIVPQE